MYFYYKGALRSLGFVLALQFRGCYLNYKYLVFMIINAELRWSMGFLKWVHLCFLINEASVPLKKSNDVALCMMMSDTLLFEHVRFYDFTSFLGFPLSTWHKLIFANWIMTVNPTWISETRNQCSSANVESRISLNIYSLSSISWGRGYSFGTIIVERSHLQICENMRELL